jgi:hypothetical protein
VKVVICLQRRIDLANMMQKLPIALLLLPAFFSTVSAECANGCNGHGKCTSYDMCICNRNWQASDCSERVCQFGLAHVDTPKGDLDMSGDISDADTPVIENSFNYPYGTTEMFPAMQDTDLGIQQQSAHYYMEFPIKVHVIGVLVNVIVSTVSMAHHANEPLVPTLAPDTVCVKPLKPSLNPMVIMFTNFGTDNPPWVVSVTLVTSALTVLSASVNTELILYISMIQALSNIPSIILWWLLQTMLVMLQVQALNLSALYSMMVPYLIQPRLVSGRFGSMMFMVKTGSHSLLRLVQCVMKL